jgi:hypothetical protein
MTDLEITDHEKSTLGERDLAAIKRMRYVPPYPDISGYHWIRRFRGGPAIPLYWNALWHRNGAQGWGQWAQPDREDQWEYCGRCISPDDTNQPPKAVPY